MAHVQIRLFLHFLIFNIRMHCSMFNCSDVDVHLIHFGFIFTNKTDINNFAWIFYMNINFHLSGINTKNSICGPYVCCIFIFVQVNSKLVFTIAMTFNSLTSHVQEIQFHSIFANNWCSLKLKKNFNHLLCM